MLVTCVSLLQLPVPMLHTHDAYESPDVLCEHVGNRHGEVDVLDDEMHWHFVLPRELKHEHDSEQDSSEDETSLACLSTGAYAGSVNSSLDRAPFGRILILSSTFGAGVKRPVDGLLQRQHPQSNLRLSVSVCALLCVVHC
ncbi:hypothetical protein HG15A2_04320 [Adhaeretor mobilis]|uniref:Uncharacterized protein n=2 Tax=Adhaeretor mobilis TaxID=1930276 RepID=A0A517MQM0_9BACT|nr:hypothetical protein HG15A2_04320 [Adhaeretor mobilis]